MQNIGANGITDSRSTFWNGLPVMSWVAPMQIANLASTMSTEPNILFRSSMLSHTARLIWVAHVLGLFHQWEWSNSSAVLYLSGTFSNAVLTSYIGLVHCMYTNNGNMLPYCLLKSLIGKSVPPLPLITIFILPSSWKKYKATLPVVVWNK